MKKTQTSKAKKATKTMFLGQSKEKLRAPRFFSKNLNSNQKALITISHLKKHFRRGKKKLQVLKDVNLQINDRQNLALLGANGAGKTTLVECIVGTTKQDSGEITYNYDYVNNFQEKLGIQFQDSSYPGGLKVKNIVNFMVEVYDVPIKKKELDDLVFQFGLKELWKHSARSLSGGQKQRLNILLALLHQPKIVFLDELSTGLDISAKEQVTGFIKDYCQKHNITIVLVSHDVHEIEQLCDRIVILQSGKIKVDVLKKDIAKNFGNINNLLRQYI